MYRVTVSCSFSAFHQLRLANGELEEPHEHEWAVEVAYAGPEMDASGMLVDFVEAREDLDRISAQLDGANLNQSPLLAGANPTAECVARVICESLARVGCRADLLESVRVGEAPGCHATFFPTSGK